MIKNEKIPALLIISGPTASGKSTLAESISFQYGIPILSADSRQIYQGFDIGTAKPSKSTLRTHRYELIDILEPEEKFSAGQFSERAAYLINHVYSSEPVIIIAGGTGFYIKALMKGLADTPEVIPEIDKKWDQLWEEQGIEQLQKEIENRDPVYTKKGDVNNPHRLLRALKIKDQTGKSIYDYTPKSLLQHQHPTLYIGLHHERPVLYQRIEDRVDEMLEQGLVDEVRSLLPYRNAPAMQTVGYRELLPHLDGLISLDDAVDKIKQHSRNYAKRQGTWMRKHGPWNWITADDTSMVSDWLSRYL